MIPPDKGSTIGESAKPVAGLEPMGGIEPPTY
jgi:hypothetical protein